VRAALEDREILAEPKQRIGHDGVRRVSHPTGRLVEYSTRPASAHAPATSHSFLVIDVRSATITIAAMGGARKLPGIEDVVAPASRTPSRRSFHAAAAQPRYTTSTA